MPNLNINGTDLYYEIHGSTGETLVLVHGSWVDHYSWNAVIKTLTDQFRVLIYDRRGHSKSARGTTPVTMTDHISDLCGLIESLDFATAHVAANSSGAIIALRLGVSRPDLFKSLMIHEPPLTTLLAKDETLRPQMEEASRHASAVVALLEQGKTAEGVELFVDTMALGPGQWAKMPQQVRDLFISNASTFLSEVRDPASFDIELASLRAIRFPVLLTTGTLSPPMFGRVAALLENAIPGVERKVFDGAGHVPQSTHPGEYIATIGAFVAAETIMK